MITEPTIDFDPKAKVRDSGQPHANTRRYPEIRFFTTGTDYSSEPLSEVSEGNLV
jgi:hypothetical protein